MVEGIAAVAIVFILFTVVVQAAFVLIAHSTAESVVASAARAGALRPGVSSAQLVADLETIVPGARDVEAVVRRNGVVSRAWARIQFVPPGPMLQSFDFEVQALVPIVVAP